MKAITIGLSGGMDSATLLGSLLEKGEEVHCCVFNYGSKHNKWENQAAEAIIAFYKAEGFPVIAHLIDISKVMEEFKSNLLLAQGEIPEGHYREESMRLTVVPGRNLIFAAVMAGLAESVGSGKVALGVHSGDHHIYPDCRKEFVKALDAAVFLSSDKQVEISAPFSEMDKTSILELGFSFDPPVPYHLTRTCYKDQPASCGKCGSCNERLEAFGQIGRKDPVCYE